MTHRDLTPDPSWYDSYAEFEFVPDNPRGHSKFPEATPKAPKCELILGDGRTFTFDEPKITDERGSILAYLKSQPKREPNAALADFLRRCDAHVAVREALGG